jgi:hypothetical protein
VRPAVLTSKRRMLPRTPQHRPLRYGSLPGRVKPATAWPGSAAPGRSGSGSESRCEPGATSRAESRKLAVFLRVPAKTRPSLLSSIIRRC